MSQLTGYDDRLPATWRDYDDHAEYQAQVASDLAVEAQALLADVEIPF